MDDEVSKTATLTKVPLPVEESRAQRLQRQQARFRDRGGIFVPSSRNTLVDILLGRNVAGNSPKKSGARSRSRSPVKKVGKRARCLDEGETLDVDSTTSRPKRRTSPRKIPRYATQEKEGENPEAGPSSLPSIDLTKLAKKPTGKAAKSHKLKVTEKDDKKFSTKRRGRPPKAKVVDCEDTSRALSSKASKSKQPADARPRRASGKTAEQGSLSTNETESKSLVADDTITRPSLRRKVKAVASFPETTQAPSSKDKTSKHESIPDRSQVPNAEPAKKRLKRSGGTADVRTESDEAVHLVPRSRDPEESEYATSAPLHKDPKQPRKPKGKERQADSSLAEDGHASTETGENAVRMTNKRVRLLSEPCIEESDIPDKRSNKRLTTARDVPRPETEQKDPTTSNRLGASKKRSRELEPVDDAKDPVTHVARKAKRSKAEVSDGRTSPVETVPESRRLRGNQDKSGKATKGGKGKKSRQGNGKSHSQEQAKPKPAFMILSKSKLKGPRKSVIMRMKMPLPPIEDDEPDPINFLS